MSVFIRENNTLICFQSGFWDHLHNANDKFEKCKQYGKKSYFFHEATTHLLLSLCLVDMAIVTINQVNVRNI